MNYKLKITLSIVSLLLASVIPLSIINYTKANNAVTFSNTNVQAQSNNVQRVNNVNDIVLSSSKFGVSMFAIVTDIVNGDRLYAWGNNSNSQLGLGNDSLPITTIKVPTLVSIPNYNDEHRITAVVANEYATAIVINNELYLCGINQYALQGNGMDDRTKVSNFTKLNHDWEGNIKQVMPGNYSFLLLTDTNKLWGWGHNSKGELMDNINLSLPTLLDTTLIGNISEMGTGNDWAWALNTNKELFMWGSNYNGELGNGSGEVLKTKIPAKVILTGDVEQAQSGGYSMYATLSNGELYGWGYCGTGELGVPILDGSVKQLLPLKIAEGKNMKIIVAADWVIISYDGIVYGTGQNGDGELGLGHQENVSNFTEIELPNIDINNIKHKITRSSTMIIDNNDIFAWGNNLHFAYGDGTKISSNKPTKIDSFGQEPSKFTPKFENTSIKASAAFAEIYKNNTIDKDALKKYVDFSFPSDAIFSVIGTPTYNDKLGVISLKLSADKWYTKPDGAKSITAEEFTILINNFNAKTTTTPKTSYPINKSATQTYDYLTNGITVAKLEEYVEIVLKPTDFTNTDLSFEQAGLIDSINNITGELKFNIILTNYYDENRNIQTIPKKFPITLSGFIKDSSITAKIAKYNVSAQEEIEYFKTLTTENDKQKFVEKYAIIALNSNANIDWANITVNQDNALDTLVINFATLTNFYNGGEPQTNLPLPVKGFAVTTNITQKQKTIMRNDVPSNIAKNILIEGRTISQEIIEQYIDLFDISEHSVITIIKSIADDVAGTITLELKVVTYYEDGVLISGVEKVFSNVEIHGFTSAGNWWTWIVAISGIGTLIGLIVTFSVLYKKKITAKYVG